MKNFNMIVICSLIRARAKEKDENESLICVDCLGGVCVCVRVVFAQCTVQEIYNIEATKHDNKNKCVYCL